MSALPFRLIVITDWSRSDLLQRLDAALLAGPGIAIQHRHPGVTTRQLHDEAVQVQKLCDRHHAPLFVNGRLDVALAVGAHLHLPSTAIAAAEARRVLPRERLISVAVHDEAEAARGKGADLALISPVFEPRSKPLGSHAPLGLSGFARLAAAFDGAHFALGGLTAETARHLSCDGAATIDAVLGADDPTSAAAELLRAVQYGT